MLHWSHSSRCITCSVIREEINKWKDCFFYPLAVTFNQSPLAMSLWPRRSNVIYVQSLELQQILTDPLSIRENDTTHKRNLWYSLINVARRTFKNISEDIFIVLLSVFPPKMYASGRQSQFHSLLTTQHLKQHWSLQAALRKLLNEWTNNPMKIKLAGWRDEKKGKNSEQVLHW